MFRLALRRAIFAFSALALAPISTPAQRQSVTADILSQSRNDSTRIPTPVGLGPSDRAIYAAAGAALVTAIALDHPARDNILATRTPFLNRLAPIGNAIGLARYAVPTVAAAFVAGNLAGRLAGHPRLADAATHLALSYGLADASEALLKFAVGRQRPSYAGDMDRFHPFNTHGEWQSFPSAHVTHIGAIAAAMAEEAHTPWVTALSSAAVTLTAWQRIYTDQHWASDVVGGAIVAVAASRLTAHWLRHKIPRRP